MYNFVFQNTTKIYFGENQLGHLTGTIQKDASFDSLDFRRMVPRFTPENITANQELVNLIQNMAAVKNIMPAQIALWVLAQKPWIVPIPGTRNMKRLEENLGAATVPLSEQELTLLNAALTNIKVSGDRYPAGSDAAKRVGK
ncbi:MAG TPA: aldo/keto reductase [Methylomusa anaerophila]|uniref:Putative oxidoreductase YdbC n=1 Tax=Methylomusa anaerophila TaxID=1930071 RepID=A0A348ANA1_9FIRM|nr:aldo/keto reductase [Methylomusa anaerophila]BBB92549.1 putative oxidoreductase YdbC [Methylomusa anaerophila]HML87596.1 aldo/keto reductase [Methylomusa anaerophila]